jgi:UDP-N-acetylmuramoyl-L-alanyl-D-glutamate--2,6-diaminopimelate ligase
MYLKQLVPQKVKNIKHYLAAKFYSIVYGHPSKDLTVIGITGTDGKTSTSIILHKILSDAGLKVGLVTTIKADIGGEELPTGLHVTSPSPRKLQQLLKKMVEAGLKYVVLETTSHGLDQHRVEGIKYDVAVFTNVTHEHLDYHKSYQNYLKTKSKLIDKTDRDGFVILNREDESYDYLKSKALLQNRKVFSYGFTDEADLITSNFKSDTETDNATFDLEIDSVKYQIETNLPGKYNALNTAAALGVAHVLDLDPLLTTSKPININTLKGRWEVIQKTPFKVIVDFAHTPNSLEKVLKIAQDKTPDAKVISVFGSAGKRDIEKRPSMGRAAAKFADKIILTAEDPRGESISEICNMIGKGIKAHEKEYVVIEDRKKAIEYALEIAEPGDTVIITGKGHEESMNIDGESEIPWSDKDTVLTLLSNMENKGN